MSWYTLNSWSIYVIQQLKVYNKLNIKSHIYSKQLSRREMPLTMYSNTKYKMSFSLMTSLSFTIFGWFILRNDCHKKKSMMYWRKSKARNRKTKNSRSYYLHFSQIYTLLPWIILFLHFFYCNLSQTEQMVTSQKTLLNILVAMKLNTYNFTSLLINSSPDTPKCSITNFLN